MNISSSLSGMNAAQNLLQSSAQNIANLSTPVPQAQNTAPVTRATPVAANLETSMVQQLQAKNSFLTNLSVFKTNNEMLGTLLNISA